jgi:hypothetical protein
VKIDRAAPGVSSGSRNQVAMDGLHIRVAALTKRGLATWPLLVVRQD